MKTIHQRLSLAASYLERARIVQVDKNMPKEQYLSAYMRRKGFVDRGIEEILDLVREYAWRRGDLKTVPRAWAAKATQQELDLAYSLFCKLMAIKPYPDGRQPPQDPYQAFLEQERR